MHRERGNALIAIIGILLIVFFVAYFQNSRFFWDTLNIKQLVNLPCGVTIEHPDVAHGEKLAFPLLVSGYANGCGWEPKNGIAGTAQVFDSKGLPLTGPVQLVVPPESTMKPYYFSAYLKLITPPTTDTGYAVLTSTTGLVSSLPLTF